MLPVTWFTCGRTKRHHDRMSSDASDAPHEERDATEPLFGTPRTMGRLEVSEAAGVPFDEARRYWHALGFPAVRRDQPQFTEADVEALRHVVQMTRRGRMDDELALSMARAIGRTADRLAAWQSSLLLDVELTDQGAPDELVKDIEARMHEPLGSGVAGDSRDDAHAAHLAAQRLVELADELEPLMVYAWRRHLSAAVNRLFSEGRSERGGTWRTVGFADMVGFTTLVTTLSEQQLGRLIARFEEIAGDVVTAHAGRVVKTVGDEVLFTADTAQAGTAIGVELVRVMSEDPSMPRLRVGVASGSTVDHLGDLFGTTVNRASRITEVTRPDAVVVDDSTAAELGEHPTWRLKPLEPRPLRGLGVTGMWVVRDRG